MIFAWDSGLINNGFKMGLDQPIDQFLWPAKSNLQQFSIENDTDTLIITNSSKTI
tara:strand:- start:3880 stop:4044 length:165 start_codon:yes stop_codon:yes gene_type:complete